MTPRAAFTTPPRTMKTLLAFATASVGLGAAAALDLPATRLQRGDITRWITVPGELHAHQRVMLYAKVGGYLAAVNADIGDEVKRDAVLAEIEVPELIADQARLKAELDVAQVDFDRTREAVKKASDLVVPQTLDTARGRLDVAKANVQRNQTMLNFAKVRAPFDGVVTRRFVDPGAFVPAATAGTAAQQPALFTVEQVDRLRLRAAVPEYESALAGRGRPVTFTLEALPGRSFEATIARASGALDAVTRTLLVECDIDNGKRDLRPGMYASVRLGLETHRNAPIMPVEALVMEKQTAVAFLHKDGKARRVVLKIGFNDGRNVEVLDGIGPDDPILLAGGTPLTDGLAVTAKETK